MNPELNNLEHKLLCGDPIYIGDLAFHKVPLRKMIHFTNGYTWINHIIHLLGITNEKAREYLGRDDIEAASYVFIYFTIINESARYEDLSSMPGTTVTASILQFLALVFHETVTFDTERGFLIGSSAVLDQTNYEDFREILRLRFAIAAPGGDEEAENPENDMAKMLLQRRRQLRDKLKKSQQNDNDEGAISLADLVSIFAGAHHLPPQDVYEHYDLYQFNNQFQRMKLWDDYKTSIQYLLAGAKEVEFKYWLTKIPTLG